MGGRNYYNDVQGIGSPPVVVPVGVPYVVDGDSNSMISFGGIFPDQWSLFATPAPLENNAVGNTRLTQGISPCIDRIPGDLLVSGVEAIAITWGPNDIRDYMGVDLLTPAQTIAKLKEDIIAISRLCISSNVAFVIGTCHYLREAIDVWNATPKPPWNGTGREDCEALIDTMNAWLLLLEGPLTWTVADIRPAVNDPDGIDGLKGMKPGFNWGGAHWDTVGSELIGPIYQDALSRAVQPQPQTFHFDESILRITDYLPENTLTGGQITFDIVKDSNAGVQTMLSTKTIGGFPNMMLQSAAGGTGNIAFMFGGPSGYNVLVPSSRPTGIEMAVSITWPAGATAATVEIGAIYSGTPGTVAAFAASQYLALGTLLSDSETISNSWVGNIKNLKIYDGGYLIHDLPINDGGSDILDLITGDTYILTAGSGAWT